MSEKSETCLEPFAAAGALTPPAAPRLSGASFSLGTLFLLTTLAALCCRLAMEDFYAGMAAAAVLALVVMRLSLAARSRARRGLRLTLGLKFWLVGSTLVLLLCMATVTLVAGFSAFLVVAAAFLDAGGLALSPAQLNVSRGAGIIVGLLAFCLMWQKLFRDPERLRP